MPFFPEHKKSPKATDPDDFDFEMAEALADAIKKKNKITKSFSIRSWSKTLHLLRKDGVKRSRIRKVMKWYCSSIGDDYVPLALSAKSFREKFLKIEIAMSRALPAEAEPMPEQCEKLVEELLLKHWPKNSDALLPQVVHKSWKAASKFRKALVALTKCLRSGEEIEGYKPPAPKKRAPILYLAEYVKLKFPSVRQFLESWFNRAWLTVCDWEDWNGNLKSFAFNLDNKFDKLGADWAYEYCADHKRWDLLMKEINKIIGVRDAD